MTKLNELLNFANESVESDINMAETSKGGSGPRTLEPGYYKARFVEYIEFGKHGNDFDPKKDPRPMCKLGFAVYEDGNEHPVFMRSFKQAISNNEKATTKLIFSKMNYKGTARHFAQMLGQAFLVPVGMDKNSKYNRIDFKNILPPFDPVSKQAYPVPEPSDDMYRLFLWNNPTPESWDSIFIEGQREDGSSKNFIQEEILSAVDFEGSPLQHMLAGGGQPLTTPKQEPAQAAPAEAPKEEPKAEAPTAPAMPEMPAMPDLPSFE